MNIVRFRLSKQACNIKHNKAGEKNLKICHGNISHDLPRCQTVQFGVKYWHRFAIL